MNGELKPLPWCAKCGEGAKHPIHATDVKDVSHVFVACVSQTEAESLLAMKEVKLEWLQKELEKVANEKNAEIERLTKESGRLTGALEISVISGDMLAKELHRVKEQNAKLADELFKSLINEPDEGAEEQRLQMIGAIRKVTGLLRGEK